MDPREFQVLSSELVAGNRASELRTAISRAYYAVHNVGVEILTEFGFRISKSPSGHGEVWNHLSNSGDSEVVIVGSKLSDLHSRRIHADYRMDKKDVEVQMTAKALVETASKMIQVLDGCRSRSRRDQMIKAIREWEGKIKQ